MLKHLNNTFSTAIIFALIWGLSKIEDKNALTIIFCVFYVFFRVKTYFDDHRYFKNLTNEKAKNAHTIIGLFLAIISWCLWLLSGYLINEDEQRLSYTLLGFSIGVSTVWIIVDAIKAGAYKEQYYWIATNIVYILILWIEQYFSSELSSMWKIILMALLLPILIFDFIKSWKDKPLEFD